MAYCEIELEFQFEDKSTKKVTFGPYSETAVAITSLKNNVKTFNETNSDWYESFVNENGSKLIASGNVYPNSPILNATIITNDITEIPLS